MRHIYKRKYSKGVTFRIGGYVYVCETYYGHIPYQIKTQEVKNFNIGKYYFFRYKLWK